MMCSIAPDLLHKEFNLIIVLDSNSYPNILPVISTTTNATSGASGSKQMPTITSENKEKSTAANKMWLPQVFKQYL